MFEFIHAADIHLDSPMLGLQRYEGAPAERIRGATREALANLVQLALDEEVRFILLAGDLYDGDWRDFNTGLYFAQQMSRLREADVDVYIVSGNHDAASQITKSLQMPDNVHRFATRKPQTFMLPDFDIAIHGQGFARRAVTKDLSRDYPPPVDGCFNIALLHTCADGREGHEPYAPCQPAALAAKGYDYWALGHVHAREVLRSGEDGNGSWIIFPGNTQGRNIREAGPKGCTLVTVEQGNAASVEHRDLDVIRWGRLAVDCTDAPDADDVIDRVRQGVEQERRSSGDRVLAVRVELVGSCRAHEEISRDPQRWLNQIRLVVTDESAGAAWVEKLRLFTSCAIDADDLDRSDAPIGDLLRFIAETADDPTRLNALGNELDDLIKAVPPGLAGEVEGGVELTDPQRLREMLKSEVSGMLAARLLARRSGP